MMNESDAEPAYDLPKPEKTLVFRLLRYLPTPQNRRISAQSTLQQALVQAGRVFTGSKGAAENCKGGITNAEENSAGGRRCTYTRGVHRA
jgi:hypothetical protein